jgi:hypothetical protein
MILFGIPAGVQRVFARVGRTLSRPIRLALPVMVLALLLAPHRRSLKTIAGAVVGDRVHASTISRRLRNPNWRTRDWYTSMHDDLLIDVHRWERRQSRPPQRRRRWTVILDTTLKRTQGHCMDNLILLNARGNPRQRQTRHHAFVMGVLLTEYGFRIPLPRRSYYTRDYCARHGRVYRTQVQLAALMLRELWLPDDVEVVALFDSAFDANAIHQVCRERGFVEVFPIDPNRNLSASPEVEAAELPGQKVVHWTRTWTRDAFSLLELQYANEDHVFWRRRHGDNLRLRKTFRRYAVAARQANVSRLGRCVIVASYKENPSVAVGPKEAADWWSVHTAPVRYRRHERPQPRRWQAKVLACTDVTATARQVVEWYALRWQVEMSHPHYPSSDSLYRGRCAA